MPSAYRNTRAQREVQQWCAHALQNADFPLARTTVDTSSGRVALTSAGTGPTQVVLVPGTASNAAVALGWLRDLSTRWSTVVVDLPGQPGLSDPRRPRGSRLSWYGRVLDEVLVAVGAEDVVLVGNSLGAAVAMSAASPRIRARALVSPAGIVRLSVDPKLALLSARWLFRPTVEHTRDMLRLFVAPGEEPPRSEVEWMALMAASCRTTLAPPRLPDDVLARCAELPSVVAVGEHDRFLPPRRLGPAVHQAMATELRVLPGMGHLTTAAHLPDVVSVVGAAVAARRA